MNYSRYSVFSFIKIFFYWIGFSLPPDTPGWLRALCDSPCVRWTGLYLGTASPPLPHQALQELSLLEMRNYLFCQQAQILLQIGKPWEVSRKKIKKLKKKIPLKKNVRLKIVWNVCWKNLTIGSFWWREVEGFCGSLTRKYPNCWP